MKSISAKKKKKDAPKLVVLKRMIQKVQKDLKQQIDRLREELQASELALAAARLRILNDAQAHDGAARLHADLQALHGLGIIDRNGNRLSKDWPIEKLQGASEVV